MSALSLRDSPVWFRLHRMNEIGEFQRILDEEDRRVVPDEVKNAFIGIKFSGEAANIAHRIGRAGAALDGRETDEYRGFPRGIAEKIRFRHVAQAAIGLKIAVRRRPARMDDSLRDPLMVKVGYFFTQNKVFQQRGAPVPRAERILIVGNPYPLIGGQGDVFAAFALVSQRVKFATVDIGRFEASRRAGLFYGSRGMRRRAP